MSTNRLSAAMYSSVHLENCAKIARPNGDLPFAAMGCNSRTPDPAGSRQDSHQGSVTLYPLKGRLVSAFALRISGFILSSWTSGRNRRDFAARVIASICHYGGLLPRTIPALGLLRL